MINRPLKIAHVITRVAWGGAEENTFSTCADQVKQGHSVSLIVGRDVEAATMERLDPDVKVVRVKSLVREIAPARDCATMVELTRTLRALAPDVVHTHMSKAGILGRLAASRAGSPIVLHGVHVCPFVGVPSFEATIYRMAERSVSSVTDAWICVSEEMRSANLAVGIGDGGRMHVVHSGMNLERFRSPNGQPPDLGPEMILCVAALEPRKRLDTLLRIFSRVSVRRPRARLVVLGEGHMRPRLERMAHALDVAERVSFLGWRPDPELWMQAAAVCVLLSGQEGMPRVVVQYVASGRPVVVSNLPGVERIVRDGKTGLVVPIDDPMAAETRIERLLSDCALRDRMSRATASIDLGSWALDTMHLNTRKVLEDVVTKKLRVGA